MLWVYDHYKYFNSYSAGIDFSHQNLTSTESHKVYPRPVRVKLFIMGIEMNREELNKTFMMISNLKKQTLISKFYTKVLHRFKG